MKSNCSFVVKSLLIGAFVFAGTLTKADDPGDPGSILGGGGSGVIVQLEEIPVDGGASYLVLAGAAYGYRRLKNRKKVKTQE